MENLDFNQPEGQQWLRGLLHESKSVCVVFTKSDGTERKMFCTLAESNIPVDKQPKSGLEEATNSKVVGPAQRVFDTEKQEWRSFRWDSIKSVSFSL